MLGSLKMPFDEIRLRLLRCDGSLEPASIQAIQKYLPPADKVSMAAVCVNDQDHGMCDLAVLVLFIHHCLAARDFSS